MAISIRTVKRALLSELNSDTFYRQAAETAGQDAFRDWFSELANLEVDQARELARRASEPSLDLHFDARRYVEKLESRPSGGMSPMDTKAVRTGDTKAVLTLARHRSAEARHIYQMLARETYDPSMRAFCEKLAHTEQDHLERLDELEGALGTPSAG